MGMKDHLDHLFWPQGTWRRLKGKSQKYIKYLEKIKKKNLKIHKDPWTTKESKWKYKKTFNTTKGKRQKDKRIKYYYFVLLSFGPLL